MRPISAINFKPFSIFRGMLRIFVLTRNIPKTRGRPGRETGGGEVYSEVFIFRTVWIRGLFGLSWLKLCTYALRIRLNVLPGIIYQYISIDFISYQVRYLNTGWAA